MKLEPLFIEKEIVGRVKELAAEIDNFFRNEEIVVIGVLKGALFFMADLLREMKTKFVYDFIQAKSYEGYKSTGEIKILKEPCCDLKGKNVLLLEDILDTGRTLSFLKSFLEKKGAKGVYVCTLLDKKKKRLNNVKADFVGFDIEDRFVVGYGLDIDERLRELKDIYIIKGC